MSTVDEPDSDIVSEPGAANADAAAPPPPRAAAAAATTTLAATLKYYIVRCAVIGEPNVGKTAILTQYVHSTFQDPTATTIGIDFMHKKIDISSNMFIKLHLWDTAGQEKFYSLVTAYLRSCCIFLLVFDVMRWQTFARAAWWLSKIRQCRGGTAEAADYHIVLVGNMRDQEGVTGGGGTREVPTDVARQWARENGLLGYHEVSAKTGEGIADVFEDALCHLMAAGVLTDTPESGVPPCPTGVQFYGAAAAAPSPGPERRQIVTLSSLGNRSSWRRRISDHNCC